MSGVIDHYLAQFDYELGYDRKLARRVRAEIASHLEESLDNGRAETDALASFGSPRKIACDYAAAALPGHVRAAWRSTTLLAFVVFAMMRIRSWSMVSQGDEASDVFLTALDRTAFVFGIAMCLLAWKSTVHASPLERAHRIGIPLAVAVTAFLVSISASCAKALIGGGDTLTVVTCACVEMAVVFALMIRLRLVYWHAAHVMAAGRADPAF